MTVALLVPLATTCPHRQRAWAWLEARYRERQPDWEIVTGTTDGAWSKGAAVADALGRTSAELLIVADADVWCDQLPDFVAAVAAGTHDWATPHRRIVRLNEQATDLLVAGELALDSIPHRRMLDQAEYDGYLGGGIVVVPRPLYEQCPLDPRFEGWGGEDESWGRALATLTGSRRRRLHGDHVLWHLWHPPQERENRRMGNAANRALMERYRQAAGEVDATLALIEEGRCRSTTSSSVPSPS